MSGPSKKHGISKDKFVKFCFKGGKSFRGEVQKKKQVTRKRGSN